MTLYWLSRNGESPQGPLLLSQLRIMRDQGRVSAEDLICAEGAEDWQSADALLAAEPAGAHPVARVAPQPVVRHSRGGWMPEDTVMEEPRPFMKVVVVTALLLCLSAVLYITFAPMFRGTRQVDRQAMQREAIKSWAVGAFKDPQAQLLELSEPLSWYDGDLRLVRVKTDGVANTWVVQFNWGTRQVAAWWTPSEWKDRFSATDKAVTYADTARIIFDAYERRLPSVEPGVTRAEGIVSKP